MHGAQEGAQVFISSKRLQGFSIKGVRQMNREDRERGNSGRAGNNPLSFVTADEKPYYSRHTLSSNQWGPKALN